MFNRFTLALLAAVGSVAVAGSPRTADAQAGTYYLSATSNPPNTVEVSLLAGLWRVGVSDGGWSPWNSTPEDCDSNGANCRSGFHSVFYYTVNGGPVNQYGLDGTLRPWSAPSFMSDFFATPALAGVNALAPFTLDLAAPATLRLFIQDFCSNGQPCYWDNSGGMNVRVAALESAVPEPSSYALIASGLVGLAFLSRRRLGR
jgi:hypothetical protein